MRWPGVCTGEAQRLARAARTHLPIDVRLRYTVSGQAPLVDLTSAEVGGTLDSAELVEMPLQNRSAFAAISLLPGIQFLPSSSQGNDTIIANGQTAAASSLNVDGGYNGDSTGGGSCGSQVKAARSRWRSSRCRSSRSSAASSTPSSAAPAAPSSTR